VQLCHSCLLVDAAADCLLASVGCYQGGGVVVIGASELPYYWLPEAAAKSQQQQLLVHIQSWV
jgi:hypothetical protein